MRTILGGILLVGSTVLTAPALCAPPPSPGAADVRAYRECQDSEVKKLDDGKRAQEDVAGDLAARCQKQYEAMSAAVLRMFGKPAWMSNFDSSLATVQANRNGRLP